MSKSKVIVSACLLGEYCRYDGKTKIDNKVLEAFSEYEIIPFCPEAPIFGTPREKINIVKVDGQERVITENTNRDVTKLLEDEVYAFIEQNPNPQAIVLKSKSPSCGLGTTPIFNNKKELIMFGTGIASKIFKTEYVDVSMHDELYFR